jgi:hypothetical protein
MAENDSLTTGKTSGAVVFLFVIVSLMLIAGAVALGCFARTSA